MIAILQPLLAPYRVPFFNAIQDVSGIPLTVVVSREAHARSRPWTIEWNDVSFDVAPLRTVGVRVGTRTMELSLDVRSALDRIRPDRVVLPGWGLGASWAALRWCHRAGRRPYAWIESHAESSSLKNRAADRARRYFLTRCAGVIVPGEQARQLVTTLLPGARCWTVPNAIEARELRALAPPTGGGALYVGEMSRRKGVDVILDAAEGIIDSVGELVVVGHGPLAPAAERMARWLKGMRYEGFLEKAPLREEFERCRAVLLPSRRDPWPLVAVEALVAGRPVVLGPGVGSIEDLEPVGSDAVVSMDVLSADGLVEALARAAKAQVPKGARERFLPRPAAEAFVKALGLEA